MMRNFPDLIFLGFKYFDIRDIDFNYIIINQLKKKKVAIVLSVIVVT